MKLKRTIFSYYPDEITITETELIGLTVDQAKRVKFEKDMWSLKV